MTADRPGPTASVPAGLTPGSWRAAATIVILTALSIGFVPIPRDPDLWFHLASGRHTITHGAVPDTDPFSMTRQGERWIPHSWLFDVAVAAAWPTIGPRGIEAVMALVYAAVILTSLSILAARRVHVGVAVLICVALAVGAHYTRGIRPQVWSLLGCAVLIHALVRHRFRPGGRRFWLIPLMFLVWAQVHSACILGLVVIAVWLVGRTLDAALASRLRSARRELLSLVGLLALSTCAVLITPHPITHFEYVAMTMDITHLGRVKEWQPPQALVAAPPHIYIYLLIGGVIALLARRARRIGWAETTLCVSLIVLGLSAIRHIPLACIGSMPLAAAALGRPDGPTPTPPFGTWRRQLAPAILVLVLVAGLWNRWVAPTDRYARYEPVLGAAALAALDRPLRTFTTYNTGSYILCHGGPENRVFVDSRADVYGDEILAQALRARAGVGWKATFEEWNIDAAVVERGDTLADVLRIDSRWALVAEEPGALTFVRRGL